MSVGGVLTNDDGEIQAIYAAHTKHATKGSNLFYMGLPVKHVVPYLSSIKSLAPQTLESKDEKDDKDLHQNQLQHFSVRQSFGLEVELGYTQVAQARILGLSDEWVKKIEGSHLSRRNVLIVRRVTSGNDYNLHLEIIL
jgi:hypothetical protein